MSDPLRWFKSSHSDETGCVEAAVTTDAVRVRDSKDPGGAHLAFTHDEWRAFVTGVKDHEFDL